MDPLSQILALLKLESYVSGAFDAGGRWSIQIPADPGIKFYAVISGTCRVIVDGVAEPVEIATGDCVLLPHGRAFEVGNDPALTPVDVFTIGSAIKIGGVTTYNGGGDFFCLIGNFTLSGSDAQLLLGMLPPIMHISSEADKTMLRWCIERMREELRAPQPGGSRHRKAIGDDHAGASAAAASLPTACAAASAGSSRSRTRTWRRRSTPCTKIRRDAGRCKP